MKNLILLAWISLGGIAGTISRYLLTISLESRKSGDFPLATFLINIAGCFIFGFISELSSNTTIIKPEAKLAITTGFAGAFTTFSTFMYENYQLSRDSQFFLSFLYMALSLISGAVLLYFGVLLARLITK